MRKPGKMRWLGAMMARFRTLWRVTAALLSICAASCANQASVDKTTFTPVRQCAAATGPGAATEYIIELGRAPDDQIVLGVQEFSPGEANPEPIIRIILSNGARLDAERLGAECICGVSFQRMDAMCAYLSIYQAVLQRDWLNALRESGLSVQFELANGRVITGPTIAGQSIEKFLAKRK